MNQAIILGRITKDIEVKRTQNDKIYTKFTLAVNRRGKDAGTDFITCMAWEKTAELIEKYCKKGSQLCVAGRIQTGSYDDMDGKKVYTTDVIAEEVTFIWDKKENATQPNESAEVEESLPF